MNMDTPLHILMVDDSPQDLELAAIALEAHQTDTRVVTFSSGVAALDYLRDPGTILPHVVILDLNMPLMNGLEVLDAIRTDPHLQSLTVVILSTSNDSGDIQAAYRLFASSYMVKQQNFTDFMYQIDQFVAYWRLCQFPLIQKFSAP